MNASAFWPVAVALCLVGCKDSQLDAGESASKVSGAVVEVESSGGQSAKIAGLYVERMAKRLRIACKPPQGARAELALAVDRDGYITEVGIRAEPPPLVVCARSELARQRLPKAKTRTLIGATLQY